MVSALGLHLPQTVVRPASAAVPSVAVYDCSNQPEIQPSTFDLFCDGSGSFTRLRWNTWNASKAAATGVLYLDNCVPDCAHATHYRSARLIAWHGSRAAAPSSRRGGNT